MAPLNPDTPITEIMVKQVVSARPDAQLNELVHLMTTHHVGCIPIVNEANHPIGIVTKLDLIECGDRQTAREAMMPIAMSVDRGATIRRVATLMSKENIHHLLVVDRDKTLVGVVSTFDLARWIAN